MGLRLFALGAIVALQAFHHVSDLLLHILQCIGNRVRDGVVVTANVGLELANGYFAIVTAVRDVLATHFGFKHGTEKRIVFQLVF